MSVFLGGETATLKSPATTAPYNPASGSDYAKNAAVDTTVKGVPALDGIKHIVGATAGFTFQATSKPVGLVAGQSKLDWNGEVWRVLEYRLRRYRGKINGVTLYLAI